MHFHIKAGHAVLQAAASKKPHQEFVKSKYCHVARLEDNSNR